MKSFRRVAILIPLLLAKLTADPVEQAQMSFTSGSGGSWNADWEGASGRTYFFQWSLDLVHWNYAPFLDFGLGTKSHGLISSSDKYFVRLFMSEGSGVTSLAEAENADFDYDGLSNLSEVHDYSTDPMNWDSDGDGMEDGWEVANGLIPTDDGSVNPNNGANGDLDGDSLSNLAEYTHSTDPRNSDTDGDGLSDYDEVTNYQTNPCIADWDGDGLDDYDEVITYGTNPYSWDTDEDTLSDGDEVDVYGTNPAKKDTDGDWMWDGWEQDNWLDPTDEADGLLDADSDGLDNQLEFVFMDKGYDPFVWEDTSDFPWNEDPDNDGLSTLQEVGDPSNMNARGFSTQSASNSVHTHPRRFDTDGDSLPDGWESENSLDPNNAEEENGTNGDPDNDGLGNFDEWLNDTDPNNPDTDGDGINDNMEVSQGSDPKSGADGGYPPSPDELIAVPFTVSDPSDSDSEKWKLTVRGLGPDDERSFSLTSPGYGQQAAKTFSLFRGNSYEISVSHIDTDPEYLVRNNNQPDYDWEATVDGKPTSTSVESFDGVPGVNNYFVVKGHWVVDNRQSVFTTEKHGDNEDLVTGHTALLVPALKRDEDVADDEWKPIRGQLAKALPGHKINLCLDRSIFKNGFSTSSPKWTLPPKVFKNYEADDTQATVTQMEDLDLESFGVHFYFADSGVKNVTMTFFLNSEAMEVETDLNIEKPIATFTNPMGIVKFQTDVLYFNLGFHSNGETTNGIDFLGKVSLPDGWPQGEWQWVQLGKVERSKTNNSNVVKSFSMNGQHALDTRYPYGATYPTGSQERASGDSPAMVCVGWKGVSATDQFETYQMFRPDGVESRYVSLKVMSWNWNAVGTRDANGYWGFTTASPPSATVPDETSNHPTWTLNLRDGVQPPP